MAANYPQKDDLLPVGNEVFGKNEAVYIIFLIFVIFCCHIVLMNVFTGLAVGDVATVMGEAEQIKARYQMKLGHIIIHFKRYNLYSKRCTELRLYSII